MMPLMARCFRLYVPPSGQTQTHTRSHTNTLIPTANEWMDRANEISTGPGQEGLMSLELITAFRCAFAYCGQHGDDFFHYTSHRHRPTCQIVSQWCHAGARGLRMGPRQTASACARVSFSGCVTHTYTHKTTRAHTNTHFLQTSLYTQGKKQALQDYTTPDQRFLALLLFSIWTLGIINTPVFIGDSASVQPRQLTRPRLLILSD